MFEEPKTRKCLKCRPLNGRIWLHIAPVNIFNLIWFIKLKWFNLYSFHLWCDLIAPRNYANEMLSACLHCLLLSCYLRFVLLSIFFSVHFFLLCRRCKLYLIITAVTSFVHFQVRNIRWNLLNLFRRLCFLFLFRSIVGNFAMGLNERNNDSMHVCCDVVRDLWLMSWVKEKSVTAYHKLIEFIHILHIARATFKTKRSQNDESLRTTANRRRQWANPFSKCICASCSWSLCSIPNAQVHTFDFDNELCSVYV